jgi:hypothetical protein
LVEDWALNKNARHLYIGIGTYKPAVKAEWKKQLALCRKYGAEGFIFYPYNSIADIEPFGTYALVPPMNWKTRNPPPAPEPESAVWKFGKAELFWKKPKDARWVNVYQQSVSMLTPVRQNVFENSVSLEAQSGEKFFLTAIDRFGNESQFSDPLVLP